MKQEQFIKKVIKIFADKSMCAEQFGKCPCNTCYHSMDGNFKHITWLIILGLRGDYNDMHKDLLEDIQKELI